MLNHKRVRYAYWLIAAFLKNNLQSFFLSFILSVVGIIVIISFSPYLLKVITTKKQVIGVTGTYETNNLHSTLPDFILSKISNGLVYVNEKGQLAPLLADSWEIINNGQEYRFHLKRDLLWNDGKAFKAQDIPYSFKDVEVKAVNDYLITFKLKKPLGVFPNYLTGPVVQKNLVGVAGLYKVAKAKTKFGELTELQLEPNKPELPILVYKFYSSDADLVNAYKLGEINELVTNKASLADNFTNWKNTKIEKTVDYSQVVALFFNFQNGLLREEKDLRKAIAQAISPDTFEKLGDQAVGPIPPTSWAYNSNLVPIQYDTEKALSTISKYNEGSQSAVLTIKTFFDNLGVADQIKEELDKASLQTRVEVLSSIDSSNFDLLVAPLQLTNDPDQYFYWHSTQRGGNIASYKNVKVDKLLEDGRNISDPSKRKEIYFNFQRTLQDEMPAFFLYYPYLYTIKRS